ncbi:cysteine hydrolase family protein [Aquicoccus sp. G2-2]|uniref:cysteine hydrolase family protein n=1 Tax=Aquicoccus sp. G2-2 TaxID=3092120 RepID=UPI002ADF19ED|nr:cysteine hydrolase family protein [Aquicoccus sp. G2-2]MEA1112739.1 cysteine hydrolase family protein [Aquicoccus sp. G2-2]
MTKTALILIDIQNDYFNGGLMALDGMDAATTNAARLLAGARTRQEAVFHIRHIAGSPSAPFFRPGTMGSEIHATVRPVGGEMVIEKSRPNSFVGTGLEAALRAAGIERVTLCGAMSQMCVDATARAAADLGFAVTVVADACAAASVSFGGISVPSEQVHAAIMAPLAASYGKVTTTGDIEGSSLTA